MEKYKYEIQKRGRHDICQRFLFYIDVNYGDNIDYLNGCPQYKDKSLRQKEKSC